LELAAAEPTRTTCIVVAQVITPSGSSSQMGLVVDGVEEVANISPADIEEIPEFGTKPGLRFLCGITKAKGKVLALLDIDRVLAADSVEKTTSSTPPR